MSLLLLFQGTAGEAVDLLTNLEGYWKFNEASGNALDSYGTLPLTDGNTVPSGTGKIDGSRDATAASSEYFSSTDAAFATGDTDYTFAGWWQSSTDGVPIFAKRDDSASTGLYALHSGVYASGGTAHKASFLIHTLSGDSRAISTVTIDDGAWHFIACGHDATTNKVWIKVDGETTVETTEADTPRSTDGAQFRFFADNLTSTTYATGAVDAWGFWSERLNGTELSTLYNSGSGDESWLPASSVMIWTLFSGLPRGSLVGGRLVR